MLHGYNGRYRDKTTKIVHAWMYRIEEPLTGEKGNRKAVWSDVGVTKLPKCFQKCLNNFLNSFYINWSISTQPKSHHSLWRTVVNKFVDKNFQNSPNLVTLPLRHAKEQKNKKTSQKHKQENEREDHFVMK